MKLVKNDPYEDLAFAIISTAAGDYRRALRSHKRTPHDTRTNEDLQELQEFFLSSFFNVLTTVSGEQVMQRIERESGVSPSRAHGVISAA